MVPGCGNIGWLVALALLSCVCCAEIYYVDGKSSLTSNCGTSWAAACSTIQSGVDAACSGSAGSELRVGPGVYQMDSLFVSCNLQMRSSNGGNSTFLEGAQPNSSFAFSPTETGNTTITGFSISVSQISFTFLTAGSNVQLEDIFLYNSSSTENFMSVTSANEFVARGVSVSQVTASNTLFSFENVSKVQMSGFIFTNCSAKHIFTQNGLSNLALSDLLVTNTSASRLLLHGGKATVIEIINVQVAIIPLAGAHCFLCLPFGLHSSIVDSEISFSGRDISWTNFLTGSGHILMERVNFTGWHVGNFFNWNGDITCDSVLFHNILANSYLVSSPNNIEWNDVQLADVSAGVVIGFFPTGQGDTDTTFHLSAIFNNLQVNNLRTSNFVLGDSHQQPASSLRVTVHNSTFQGVSSCCTSTTVVDSLWNFANMGLNTTLLLENVEIFDTQLSIVIDASVVVVQNCLFSEIDASHQPLISMIRREQLTIVDTIIEHSTTLLFLQGVRFANISSSTFRNNTGEATGLTVLGTNLTANQVVWEYNSVDSGSGSFVWIGATSLVTVSQFSAIGNQGYLGGVLYIESSNVTFTEGQFQQNRADSGGVLYLAKGSSVDLSNIEFNANRANLDGGTLSLRDAYLSAKNITISESTALTDGGALALAGNATVVAENLFVQNSRALEGGCINLSGRSTLNISNSVLLECRAWTDGGALLISDYATVYGNGLSINSSKADGVGAGAFISGYAKVLLHSSILSENISPTDGGALYLDEKTTSLFSDTLFQKNQAVNGGAMLLNGAAVGFFQGSRFIENSAESKGGTAIMGNNATMTMVNCTFDHSTAHTGGAIYLDDNSNLSIHSSYVRGNQALSRGGAIASSGRSVAALNLTVIEQNLVIGDGFGGGFAIQDSGSLSLLDCHVTNNSANQGGAIYSSSESALGVKISGGELSENVANSSGGALCLTKKSRGQFDQVHCHKNQASFGGCVSIKDHSTLNVSRSLVERNSAMSGAGFWIGLEGSLSDSESIISYNTAQESGGGLGIYGGDVEMDSVQISHNTAHSGAGIYGAGWSGKHSQLCNCVIQNNNATDGGGIYLLPSSSVSTASSTSDEDTIYVFFNATVGSNRAVNGGGIYVERAHSNLPTFGPTVNLTANQADHYGGAIYFRDYDSGISFITGGLFEDNVAGWGGSSAAFTSNGGSSNFCTNCSFVVQPSNSSYNSLEGFASPPSHLVITNSSNNYTSGSSTFYELALQDDFHTIVQGDYLLDNIYNILVPANQSFIVDPEHSESMQVLPSTGFLNFTGWICGTPNSAVEVQFQSFPQSNPPDLMTAQNMIQLSSCSGSDYGVVTVMHADNAPCITCVYDPSFTLTEEEFLAAAVAVLLLLLCILVGGYFISYARRTLRKRHYDALEIPDFTERPTLTLADVLADASIYQIKWSEITIKATIGKGASGLVSQGLWTPSNGPAQDVALKELIIGFDELLEEILHEFLVEIKYMSALSHPHIVRFLGIVVSPDETKIYLVTELMEKGSLRDVLWKKKHNIPPSIRLKMARDAAKGVAYLHSKKLIHRDLKSHNLLVNSSWDTKVADFGISTVRPTITRAMTCVGTPAYMAPEVLSRNKYSEKADVYSFGVVMMEIFTNEIPYSQAPYAEMNQAMLMHHITEKNARPCIDGLNPLLQTIIQECWSADPQLRPTFPEIVARLKRLRSQFTDPPRSASTTSSPSLSLRKNLSSFSASSGEGMLFDSGTSNPSPGDTEEDPQFVDP